MTWKKTQKKAVTLSKGITKEQQKAIDEFYAAGKPIMVEVEDVEEFVRSHRDLVAILEAGGVDCSGATPEELSRCRAYAQAQAMVLEKKNLAEVVKSSQTRELIKTLDPMVNEFLTEIYVVSYLPQGQGKGLVQLTLCTLKRRLLELVSKDLRKGLILSHWVLT